MGSPRRPSSRSPTSRREETPSSQTLGLRRDPALVPLSRDHHQTLVHAQALKRAALQMRPQDKKGALEATARAFMAFHKRELLHHMADEEEVLLPRAESTDPEGAERLRGEHLRIKALSARLETALESGPPPAALLQELGCLLEDHVRFEERAFFMAVQAMLKPEALRSLGRALLDRRGRREDARGCAVPSRE